MFRVLWLSVLWPVFGLTTLSNSGFAGAPRKPLDLPTRILLSVLAVTVPGSFTAAWIVFSVSGLRPSAGAGVLCAVAVSGIVMYLASYGVILLVVLQNLRNGKHSSEPPADR